MEIKEIAKSFAIKNKLPRAESYDMVEVIGYVPDPTYDMRDFVGREMLFPKRWVTLSVVPADTVVKV